MADTEDRSEEKLQIEALKEENRRLRERCDALYEACLKKNGMITEIAATKSMVLHRKAMVKTGKGDFLTMLRPVLSQAEAQLFCHIDTVSYRGNELVIRGWAYDLDNLRPAPVLVRDRSRIIPHTEQRYPRKDVSSELGVSQKEEAGFSVKVRLSDISHRSIMLEFDNEKGCVAEEVPVLLTEEERRRHMEETAEPVYASDNAGYDDWFHEHRVTDEELRTQAASSFPYEPLISICIPLYNTPERFLKELMDSLLSQSYKNFEICLADGSTSDEPGRIIKDCYGGDSRVVYKRLTENAGISGNTNASFAMAKGDFILLCDHDDTMEADALYEIVKAINEDPKTDVIYTDEDKLMLTQDVFYSPNFKPDYSPDLLRSNNYITHIFCVRKSIVDENGGERSEFDGAQDYDFIFRCCEQARVIKHVPKVLYHWRAHEDSTAGDPASKLYAYENGRRAIEAHYKRTGIPARVERAEDIGSYRTYYEIQGEPLVSIIIPNKDMTDVLKRAVDSIFEKSTYRNFEIVIAENNSETDEIFEYYRELCEKHENVTVVTWPDAFNYSAINNFAAKEARGDYLIFLNNDTEVITERWIEEMLGYCQREDVGICGARLYYPDDRLQHCGVVVGIGGIAGHICHLEKRENGGYFGRVFKSQDVSAVTAACLMIPKKVFEEVGGFDETLAIAYNDVDLCLKVRDRGLLVVYDSWCLLYHYESLSRGSDEADADKEKHARQMREAAILRKHWPEIFKNGDPYFNPNLDYDAADYVLKGTIPHNYSTLQSVHAAIDDEGQK